MRIYMPKSARATVAASMRRGSERYVDHPEFGRSARRSMKIADYLEKIEENATGHVNIRADYLDDVMRIILADFDDFHAGLKCVEVG